MPELNYKIFESEIEYREKEDDFIATVSTGDVDREGDIIEPKGMELEEYMKKPIILYRHNRTPGATAIETLPVGRMLWAKVVGNKVKMAPKFHQETELSRKLHWMYKKGFMTDWSIGYKPLDRIEDNDITGRHLTRCSVHEVSTVPIGMNQFTDTQIIRLKELRDSKEISEDFYLELISENEKEFEGEDEGEEVKDIKPYPNEHSARLQDPDRFDEKTYRRKKDGTIYGKIKVPATISVIWGKLKEHNKPADNPIPQALRFPIENWTVAEAKKWLKDNNIKYTRFEPAKKEDVDFATKEDLDRIKKEIVEELTTEIYKALTNQPNVGYGEALKDFDEDDDYLLEILDAGDEEETHQASEESGEEVIEIVETKEKEE